MHLPSIYGKAKKSKTSIKFKFYLLVALMSKNVYKFAINIVTFQVIFKSPSWVDEMRHQLNCHAIMIISDRKFEELFEALQDYVSEFFAKIID